MKFDNKWVHMYELAKVSVNNRANEIKSIERRSGDHGGNIGTSDTCDGDSGNYIDNNALTTVSNYYDGDRSNEHEQLAYQ